jgi:hypothetical protein
MLEFTTVIKRTIKPAAGTSRVTEAEATAAARVVYRDKTTGRLIVLGPGESRPSGKKRRVSGSPTRLLRRESKKR